VAVPTVAAYGLPRRAPVKKGAMWQSLLDLTQCADRAKFAAENSTFARSTKRAFALRNYACGASR
jgi:hypothetical protein